MLIKKKTFYSLDTNGKLQRVCNVMPSHPTHSISRPAGDQLVAEGVTHISLPLHKNTIGGTGENKTDEQTRTKFGVNQEQKEVLQHYMHVRTIASVGY